MLRSTVARISKIDIKQLNFIACLESLSHRLLRNIVRIQDVLESIFYGAAKHTVFLDGFVDFANAKVNSLAPTSFLRCTAAVLEGRELSIAACWGELCHRNTAYVPSWCSGCLRPLSRDSSPLMKETLRSDGNLQTSPEFHVRAPGNA